MITIQQLLCQNHLRTKTANVYLCKMTNDSLHQDWFKLINKLENILGQRPNDLNAVLFLIGIQELGQGVRTFSKEEKQDLMHIATCKILSYDGYYELENRDSDGWPHYRLLKTVDKDIIQKQVRLIRRNILKYFEEQGI